MNLLKIGEVWVDPSEIVVVETLNNGLALIRLRNDARVTPQIPASEVIETLVAEETRRYLDERATQP